MYIIIHICDPNVYKYSTNVCITNIYVHKRELYTNVHKVFYIRSYIGANFTYLELVS